MSRILSLMLLVCIATMAVATPAVAEEPDSMTAFFLSFMVPGLGQWYAGSPGSAKIFIASELAIWGGYFFTSHIGDSYGGDYLAFATVHAGVTPGSHGSSYLTAIGGYDSSYEYNRAQDQMTSSPAYYEGPEAWEWDSYKSRDRFKQLRERELDFENYAKYCVAGAVLNHFLAGLNASKLVRETTTAARHITVQPTARGLHANYQWSF